jgi:DUF4097 and DUF4098 domain-containing protein YvlB
MAILVLTASAVPSPASAQRFSFERTIQTTPGAKLDVATVRGKIEVTRGAPGRVVVGGTATVRVGHDVPANAVDLARQVAASPPVEQSGNVIHIRIPVDRTVQRAVTIAYRIEVPADTELHTNSESGETTIDGVAAPVDVRTQSGAIALRRIAGAARVFTGSGAVVAEEVTGDLSVTTTSSSFRATGIGAGLLVRTQSGHVDAALTGTAAVDVHTGSSAIQLTGLRGALTAKTQSGRVTILGAPGGEWSVTTGSSSIDVALQPGSGLSLDAVSRSGSVVLDSVPLQGPSAKRAARGTVGGGGHQVRLETRSGAIRIRMADR